MSRVGWWWGGMWQKYPTTTTPPLTFKSYLCEGWDGGGGVYKNRKFFLQNQNWKLSTSCRLCRHNKKFWKKFLKTGIFMIPVSTSCLTQMHCLIQKLTIIRSCGSTLYLSVGPPFSILSNKLIVDPKIHFKFNRPTRHEILFSVMVYFNNPSQVTF